MRAAEKIVPLLNGRPKSFTKKTSKFPNNDKVRGKIPLNTTNKIATAKIRINK